MIVCSTWQYVISALPFQNKLRPHGPSQEMFQLPRTRLSLQASYRLVKYSSGGNSCRLSYARLGQPPYLKVPAVHHTCACLFWKLPRHARDRYRRQRECGW